MGLWVGLMDDNCVLGFLRNFSNKVQSSKFKVSSQQSIQLQRAGGHSTFTHAQYGGFAVSCKSIAIRLNKRKVSFIL